MKYNGDFEKRVSDHEKWGNYVRELREYLISAEIFYTYDIWKK